MSTPNLWSRLEAAGSVTSPDIGTAGAEVGSPTYLACKFGNGILSDVDDEGCTFPTGANSINCDKGTIEFWTKLNFETNDGDYHFLLDFIDVANGGIEIYFDPAEDDFRVNSFSEGGYGAQILTVGLSWSSGDILHFAIVWDREGNDIGSSKTLVLYVDNVEIVSSTDTWNTDTVNANIYIGTNQAGDYHSDAIIDNLKTYNTCLTDFTHKETEGELLSVNVSECTDLEDKMGG